MFLWFAGMSVLIVWLVFQSPMVDYRTVMLGSVLPVGEVVLGGPRVLHTLLGAALALTFVVVFTRRRRLLRRRWLGIPIGMFLHLVLDGSWLRTDLFWWPFFGWSFGDAGLPELSHGAFSLVLEAVGAGVLVWLYFRFGLDDPERRHDFLHDGHIARGVA